MIRIGIVEDDPRYAARLQEFLNTFESENGESFKVGTFEDGLEITENYSAAWDILLMDIEMKHLDGMKAAEKIREKDRNVVILFITNSAQFALAGYRVEALSYLLKPVSYFEFSEELKKAIRRVHDRSGFYLHIPQKDGIVRLDAARIAYVESVGHNAVYHTDRGEIVNRETIKSVEEKLSGRHFARCNNGCLVNLAQVDRVDRDVVYVAGEALPVSRPRRKGFLKDLADYIGGK